MAEKLGAAAWTAFAKKRNLEEPALLKALQRFDKAGEDDHEARLEALLEVVEQIKKSVAGLAKRKKELGDKPLGEAKDKLYELLDSAENLQKQTREAKTEADAQADEEEDSPALLGAKMLPLLRELRKPDVTMHALIGTAGKGTRVLIMRKPIGTPRRKLLAEALDAKGGAKFVTGTCLQENNALTFVVAAPSAGLAKRIRQALLDQTDLRLKVRVRGEDGSVDEDGEAEDSLEQAGIPPAPPLPGSDATAQWARRLPQVQAALDEALRAQHPESTKLRALIGFASEKADGQKNHAAALKALDMIEQLLRGGGGSGGSKPEPERETLAPAAVYAQTRQVWMATRKRVQGELKKLEDAILAEYPGSQRAAVEQGVRKLDRVMTLFDESLAEQLDGAFNAPDDATRRGWHGEARTSIARYRDFLGGEPLLQELDDNPFAPVAVKSTLGATLDMLATKIA